MAGSRHRRAAVVPQPELKAEDQGAQGRRGPLSQLQYAAHG